MSKTLLVGDIHLQIDKLYGIIINKSRYLNVNKVIFIGDYLDQWLNRNEDDFKHNLQKLLQLRAELNKHNIATYFIMGNHDALYITNDKENYMGFSQEMLSYIKENLLKLKPRIVYKEQGFLISHAGYTGDNVPLPWHFCEYEEGFDLFIKDELNNYGFGRDPRLPYDKIGGVLRADFFLEFSKYHTIENQIVGHTPLTNVSKAGTSYGIDTFSLNPSGTPIGCGDMLLIDNGEVKILNTNFVEITMKELVKKYI